MPAGLGLTMEPLVHLENSYTPHDQLIYLFGPLWNPFIEIISPIAFFLIQCEIMNDGPYIHQMNNLASFSLIIFV